MEMSNAECGAKLAFHIGEEVGVVEPTVHVGMSTDSVLYIKYPTEDSPCRFDFRYFPRFCGQIIKTYRWSENIKQVVIKNEDNWVLEFKYDEIKINEEIQVGETKVFTYKNE